MYDRAIVIDFLVVPTSTAVTPPYSLRTIMCAAMATCDMMQ